MIARSHAADGDVALFAHGHVLRVFVARWIGLPPRGGEHFLLDTGTLCDAPNIISVKELALSLKAKAWRTIKWREGTND